MLRLNRLCKRYGSKTVADHIDLNVCSGEILAVVGRSGCGKSTLLNMIAGIVRPDSGTVLLDGSDITQTPPEKRNISLMFQDYALFPHLTALENVGFGLKMRDVSKQETAKQAMQALCEVGLEHEAHRKPQQLSGGEQQRLALARALVVRPSLLLLDEAFSSLDTHLRRQLRLTTAGHIRARNIPALLVTHSPEEACTMADRIAVMHEGRVLQHGTPEEIIRHPAGVHVARLMGLPNTDGKRHIPTAAIRLTEHGVPCRVLSAVLLPERLQLTVAHPQYGTLTLMPDTQTDKAFADSVRIEIDETQIVCFSNAD